MTAPGTKRQVFDTKMDMQHCDTSTVSLQMGTNKVASQQGMTPLGLPRQVYDKNYCTKVEEFYNDSFFDGYAD